MPNFAGLCAEAFFAESWVAYDSIIVEVYGRLIFSAREWSVWLEYRWLSHFWLSPCSQVTHFKSLLASLDWLSEQSWLWYAHSLGTWKTWLLRTQTFRPLKIVRQVDLASHDFSWLFIQFIWIDFESFSIFLIYWNSVLVLSASIAKVNHIVFIIDHRVDRQSTSQGYGGSARRVWPD